MEETYENLKNNFLFQASLGSKELFHSNLLAWILEQRNESGEYEVLKSFIESIIDKEIDVITKENKPIIAREEKKIDLTIKWKIGQKYSLVFIENKMKSIPNQEQLGGYDKKLSNEDGHKFLLTPMKLFRSLHWKNITYADNVIPFLDKIKDFNFENAEVTNINMVIKHYISFLCSQNKILKNLDLHDLDCFKKRKYDFYDKSNPGQYMAEIRALKLHDFILKRAHSMFSELIVNEIENEFKEKLVFSHEELIKMPGNVFVTNGFTRSSGISDIKIHIEKGFLLVLQLQENTLKYAVEVNSMDSSMLEANLQFAKNIVSDKNKIWFHDNETTDKKLLTGNGKRDKEKFRINEETVFNSYGLSFIYLNKDLSRFIQKPIFELVDFMYSEIVLVQKNINEFHSHITC
jgi:hypothetical protein